MAPNSYQHIIILNDGTHLCTCLLLVSRGIVCRHYFKLMVENPNALFHVMLMPTRWFKDDSWKNLDIISKEPFIGVSFQTHQDDNNTQNIFPKHYNNIQEAEIRHHVQKKMEYGRLMGNFKKALNYSMEDDDQKDLNNLILSYITRKEKQREDEARMAVIEDTTSDTIVRLGDGRAYNANEVKDPVVRRGKGRPATKRLKASNEVNNKTGFSRAQQGNSGSEENRIEVVGRRKCHLCYEIGHYALKCPNKEN